MKPMRLLPVAAISLVLGACATVTRGKHDVLVVESEPPGATITLSNGMTGKTPGSFKLPRKDAVVVTIEKAGYETVEVNVTPKVSSRGSTAMAGNIILGGVIGAGIDAGTGAMKDLVPNPIQVNLVRLGEGGEAPAAGDTAPPPQ